MGTLETNLADVMIAELAGPVASRAADSDDRFPLIEILAEAAFRADDLVTTRKLPPRGVFIDADDTVPHALFSSPYERIDIGVELAPRRTSGNQNFPSGPRKRPATITRTALAQQRADVEADAAITNKLPRFSAPYERIEIEHARPSGINLVASGSFEAAWFVPPDAMPAELEESRARTWIAIRASALIVAAAVLAASALTLAVLI